VRGRQSSVQRDGQRQVHGGGKPERVGTGVGVGAAARIPCTQRRDLASARSCASRRRCGAGWSRRGRASGSFTVRSQAMVVPFHAARLRSRVGPPAAKLGKAWWCPNTQRLCSQQTGLGMRHSANNRARAPRPHRWGRFVSERWLPRWRKYAPRRDQLAGECHQAVNAVCATCNPGFGHVLSCHCD
jgi:hypothetical protein